MLAGAQYVATWVLQSEDAVTFLFIALIAPALFFAPIWGAIAGRIGKERAFVIASIVFGVAALSMTLLAVAPGPWVYAPVAIAGAAYAGMQSLPMAMLPDVISHDARSHGNGAAGTFGGVWTAGETTGMALGATVLTIVLAITGYRESSAAHRRRRRNRRPRSLGIVLAFSVVPAAIIALSLIPFGRYRLRKRDIDAPTRMPDWATEPRDDPGSALRAAGRRRPDPRRPRAVVRLRLRARRAGRARRGRDARGAAGERARPDHVHVGRGHGARGGRLRPRAAARRATTWSGR